MNCSWYLKPPIEKTSEAKAHTHDTDEIIGFFCDNSKEPYNLVIWGRKSNFGWKMKNT